MMYVLHRMALSLYNKRGEFTAFISGELKPEILLGMSNAFRP